MKKGIYIIIILLISIILTTGCSKNNIGDIAATVNGESIYVNDINIVVKHFNEDKYDFDTILNNTINELLVVQEAKKNNISISDGDFQAYIDMYKEELPLLFEKGVEIYGEEKFISGLKVRQIYKKMKAHVLDNIIGEITIQDTDVSEYIVYFPNVTYEDYLGLSKAEQVEVKEKIRTLKQQDLFNSWVKQLRDAAEIEYFQNGD
jgi:hypothetical protein